MKRFCFWGMAGRGCPRRSSFRAALDIVALALLCVGCNRAAQTSPTLTIGFEVIPQPARVGTVVATFTLTDTTGEPVAGAHLTSEADMTHAGMSPVFGTVEERKPGRYESELKLGMAGDWVILLHGTLPTGEKVERQFELKDVRPN